MMLQIAPARPRKTGTKAYYVKLNWSYEIPDSREEDEIKEKYLVPNLDDLGVNPQKLGPVLYPGGETEALERMERNLKKTVADFTWDK